MSGGLYLFDGYFHHIVYLHFPNRHFSGNLIKEFTGTDDLSLAPDTAAFACGRVQTDNKTCSSSITRNEPLAETLGFPVLLAVAIYAGWIVPIACFASSVSFTMMTSLSDLDLL